MGITQAFRDNVVVLDILIRENRLHAGDGPVCIGQMLRGLGIVVKYFEAEDRQVHGISFAGVASDEPGMRTMWINEQDSEERQRQTMGHELYHLLAHEAGQEYYSVDSPLYTVMEEECDYAAAYLMVPLGYLLGGMQEFQTAAEIAWELEVPVALVDLRLKMAVALDELGEL